MSKAWRTALAKERARIEKLDNDDAAVALKTMLDGLADEALAVSGDYTTRVLAMHQEDGQSFGEIAEAVGVSRSRIGQIVTRGATA